MTVKLSDADVRKIRETCTGNSKSVRDAAERFGISVPHVYKIIKGAARPDAGGPTLRGRTFLTNKDRLLLGITVNSETGCWEWQGTTSRMGYGSIWAEGKLQAAHRLAFRVFVGCFPEEMYVLHRCDNPPCCNPDHLFLGTHTDNMRDMAKKGRSKDNAGEKNDSAKLTWPEVREIRRRRADGREPIRDLADEFGVSLGAIDHIIHNRTWKDPITRNTKAKGGGS